MNFNIHNLVLCYFAFGVPVFFTSLIIVGSLFGKKTSILSLYFGVGCMWCMLYNYYSVVCDTCNNLCIGIIVVWFNIFCRCI